jgi:outer membrane cobalamin receptor
MTFYSLKNCLLFLIFVLTNLTILPAQEKGRIFGTVHDQKSGRPVESASIYLQPVSYGTETGSDGRYAITGIPTGSYRLVISRIGYQIIADQTIHINAGDEIELNFTLQPTILSGIDGIVITATRSPSLSNTIPASVDIIDKVKLDHQNPQNLAEVLNTVQGLYIKDYGGLGGIKTISMRGSNAEQVLVLLDGQRLNNAQTGQVDFSTITLAGVEKVEVVHGGNSALYGADAMGGVINLITRKENEKSGFGGSLKTLFGSFDSRAWEGSLHYQQQQFSAAITYHNLQSAGNYTFADLQGQKQRRNNNDLFARDLFSRVNFNFGDPQWQQKLNLSYKYYYAQRGSPGTLSYPSATSRLYNRMNYINAIYSGKMFNLLNDFQLQGYAHYDWNRYASDDYDIHTENSFRNGTYGLEAQLKMVLSAAHQRIWGTGMRYDWMTGSTFTVGHHRMVYDLFIQDEIEYPFDQSTLKSLLLIPAVRFDFFSDFGSHFSPKIGSTLNFASGWNIAIKGNVGLTYRAPVFNELYWPEDEWSRGNPHLRPENGYDWDIGLRMRPPLLAGALVDLTYFCIRMNDLIAWQFQDTKYVPQNIDKTSSRGVEFNLNLQPVKNAVIISYNYTYLSAVDLTTHKTLNYRPRHSGNLALILSWAGLQLELQSQSVSQRYTDAANTQRLAPYSIYNIIFSTRYAFGNFEPKLSLQVINVQNRQYQIIQDQPLPGRELRLNIGLAF